MKRYLVPAALFIALAALEPHSVAAQTTQPSDINLDVGVVACTNDSQCGSGEVCGAGGSCQTTQTGVGAGGTGTDSSGGNLQTGLPNPSSSANGANTTLQTPSTDLGTGTSGAVSTGVPAGTVTATTPAASTGFTPLAPVPGLDQGVPANQAGIATFLNNLYIFAIGIAVILAVFMIVWGGVEYALSEAITNKADGKKKITNALYGLVLVLAPTVVFSIINPSILNLNVNFPPLDTPWGNYTSPNSTPGAACTGTNCTAASQGLGCYGTTSQTPQYICINGSSQRDVQNATSCNSNETLGVRCVSTGGPELQGLP